MCAASESVVALIMSQHSVWSFLEELHRSHIRLKLLCPSPLICTHVCEERLTALAFGGFQVAPCRDTCDNIERIVRKNPLSGRFPPRIGGERWKAVCMVCQFSKSFRKTASGSTFSGTSTSGAPPPPDPLVPATQEVPPWSRAWHAWSATSRLGSGEGSKTSKSVSTCILSHINIQE